MKSAPVIITSRQRSASQSGWAAPNAKYIGFDHLKVVLILELNYMESDFVQQTEDLWLFLH